MTFPLRRPHMFIELGEPVELGKRGLLARSTRTMTLRISKALPTSYARVRNRLARLAMRACRSGCLIHYLESARRIRRNLSNAVLSLGAELRPRSPPRVHGIGGRRTTDVK